MVTMKAYDLLINLDLVLCTAEDRNSFLPGGLISEIAENLISSSSHTIYLSVINRRSRLHVDIKCLQ